MAPIIREQALENALASSRIEGYEVTEQTRADCRRLMDGKVDTVMKYQSMPIRFTKLLSYNLAHNRHRRIR